MICHTTGESQTGSSSCIFGRPSSTDKLTGGVFQGVTEDTETQMFVEAMTGDLAEHERLDRELHPEMYATEEFDELTLRIEEREAQKVLF